MSGQVYVETFDDGPGGWFGFIDNFQGIKPLPIRDGAAWSYCPWWVDYNHAPPGGAGYLQLVMGIMTQGPFGERFKEVAGPNRFVQGGYPRDFTNARLTLRIKGELELRGAALVLLVQGTGGGMCSGWVLTGQPIQVSPDWSEQRITAVPDPAQWRCLGARFDRTDMYGTIDLQTILADVNTNIYLVLFPVNAVPMGPLAGDPHVLRAGRDYPLWQSRLPEGYVVLDTVRIEFG
jgi:hypothetical protein